MRLHSVGTVLLLGLVLSGSAAGQQIPVSGTVTATDRAPLGGVTVRVLTTDSRAVTDADGKYSLTGASDGVLSFSIPGRRPIQHQILGRSTVDVSMELDRQGWWAVIPPGRPIRIVAQGQRYEGSFVRLSGERIVLNTAGASDSIAIRQVDSLWDYRQATNRGVMVGALAGAVPLSALAALAGRNCRECSGSETIALVMAGASAGTLVGAFAGAALGRKFYIWKRTYP
jgi:hypothetical protein